VHNIPDFPTLTFRSKERLGLIASQVIFVESKRDETFYWLIQANYRAVCACFAQHNYDFIYIPLRSSKCFNNFTK
jgi:hypothetical protein